MRLIFSAVLIALSLSAHAAIPDTLTGVFFTLPGTNGFVSVAPEVLCLGESPQTPKRITPESMIIPLDAFAERYYVTNEAATDPDYGYRLLQGWDNLHVLSNNKAQWKSLDLSHPYYENPWPLATNRDFSAAMRIFPYGSNALETVRSSLRSMSTYGRGVAFAPFTLGNFAGSTFFGSDQTVNIGWCTNAAFQAQLLNARLNQGYGKCFAWFAECIPTNEPSYINSMASYADDDGSLYATFWTQLVTRAESLKPALESFLPEVEGGLAAGWLTNRVRQTRITAADFSWMNALLMAMDVYGSKNGPEPMFKIRERSVVASTNATATFVIGNLQFHSMPGQTPYWAFDAKVASLSVPSVPVQTNSTVQGWAEWELAAANVGVDASFSITNGVYVSGSDILDAINEANYHLDSNWTAVRLVPTTAADGIRVYVVNPDNLALRALLVHISMEDIEALGGTRSGTAEYSVEVTTRTPINDLACLPFAQQGQAWHSRDLSAPTLCPSPYTASLVDRIAVQGYATWDSYGFDASSVSEKMAYGAVASAPTAAAVNSAADHLLITQIMPGRKEAANALAGVFDISDAKGIESQLRGLIPASSESQLAVGFAPNNGLEVRLSSDGGIEVSGAATDPAGNYMIGNMGGTVNFAVATSLPTGYCQLRAYFSLLTVYNFNNLPAPRAQP